MWKKGFAADLVASLSRAPWAPIWSTVGASKRISALLPDQEIPGSPNRDPDSRFPAESGIGPIPDSRFPADRESGIGKSPQKPGKRGIRFPIPD
jgi:hypothetical protein